MIDYRWTLGRAFSAEPLPLALALGLLALGGVALYGIHRRAGVDRNPDGQISKAGEFVPTGAGQSEFRVVGDVRPGHVGTVADERVDPIDVTATLVDLAVRGHLVIIELPRESEFARTDWEIKRVRDRADGLRPFEQQLLDGIARARLERAGLGAGQQGARVHRWGSERALRRDGQQWLVRAPTR